jgi:hypothetical protein
MFGNAGGLIACWSYVKKDAPDYLPGNALNVGAAAGIIILTAFLSLYLRNENKKRDAQTITTNDQETRHLGFRYMH